MTEKRPPSPAPATIVLVPGFWLGEWAWDAVATRLHTAGVDVEALTLPGLQPGTTDADVTLDDQIAAVVAAISRASGPVVLVGHSGAGTVITGAADRAPASLSGLVFVDSGPVADGAVASPDLAPEVRSIELPDWQTLEAAGSSLDGLDPAARAEFRRRAVPHPAGPARQPIVLTDDRRHAIPVTLVCCSITAQQVREMTAAGHPWFQELGSYAAVELIDLPTGHWPMWSRPDDLADELRRIAVRSSSAR
ncbi:alpha/beta hydrolase [Microbacterium kyungheense]|uniref:Pimeloyl-ACP methyl ester carboxylesterase n=1 Tax=Microbacterium kyungheense TaxID=1263636 RepID=A0A543F2T7_9MICO|nr:alpha/beta hydrolase [Microbacterium kyungheense]TQM28142.1 pimeloyl-ACP methyl ester carboxylesterase [Microbacterium kyungheense]